MKPVIFILSLLLLAGCSECADCDNEGTDSGAGTGMDVAEADARDLDAAEGDASLEAEIVFFLANGETMLSVGPPGSVDLSWESHNLDACTGSAEPAATGWDGSVPVTGTRTITIAESTTLTLRCGDLSATIEVTYAPGCTDDVFPPGLRRSDDTYENVNDGFPFGESTNTSFLLNLRTDRFAVLSGFSFAMRNARRRIVFIDAPTSHNQMAQGTVSVSECPGDFTEAAACVMRMSNSTTLSFSTNPADPDRFCKLDPDKTYYINYIHSTAPYDEPPACALSDDDRCAVFYTESLL